MARPKFKETITKKSINDGEPWPIKHSPSEMGALAMHTSKIKQIQACLDPNSPASLLILSGPPGAAKSTSVQLIAKSKGLNVIEYINPEATVGETSVTESFQEFLLGAAIYDPRSTLILIEDLPNLFHEDTKEMFEASLINWITDVKNRINLPRIVICFTEVEVNAKYNEALVVPRILSNVLQMRPLVEWIKVNAVNKQLLKKVLTSVINLEKLKVPASHVKLISECGDIRQALNALQLYSKDASDLWLRGDSVQLFHAIGKIVYGSSDPLSVPFHIESFQETIETFNLTLLENYTVAKHQQLPVSAAAEAAEWLSMSDASYHKLGTLAAVGVGNSISVSQADQTQPRAFSGLKFTQYPSWMKEHHEFCGKLFTKIRNDITVSRTSVKSRVLEENAFSALKKPKIPSYLIDSDTDSDDDFFD